MAALFDNQTLQFVYIPNTVVFVIIFYLIAVGGYRQQPLPLQSLANVNVTPTKAPSDRADETSQAKPNQAELLPQLTRYMREQKPFLDEQLSLTDLARGVSLSPQVLSHVINEGTGGSFYELVNRYRAEEAAERIRTTPELSMLEVGVEAGFANKATYYKHFKSRFQVTPRQYKQSLAKQG